ncbi:hypothetical protein GAY33_09315 [Azospirillum brasilense]|nr:hypothetical protein [Azospirillum argentinense]
MRRRRPLRKRRPPRRKTQGTRKSLRPASGRDALLHKHRQRHLNPLPSGERVAHRAGEGVARVTASGTSATPSP